MRCPFCNHPETKVYDSRPAEEGGTIRRRRECLGCGRRFTTFERVEEPTLVVVKRDGRRVAFDRPKLLRGMLTACEKRPVPLAVLERAAAEIERELRVGGAREVSSTAIGEAVMERLRRIDAVAYVRFASVYRQFADLGRFREELDRLQSAGGKEEGAY
ncbi:MAG: transcriptional regulator NrdR [Thermaerobacter sp.]|jgi:transcriptional repressor NrdR|nr:transcriptional regulator NrdR [Thermaerobacter sp.]